MIELFLELFEKYYTDSNVLSPHLVILYSLFCYLLFGYFFIGSYLHNKFDYNKDGKSDIHFNNYMENIIKSFNSKEDFNKDIKLSNNENYIKSENILKKYLYILLYKYVKFNLSGSSKFCYTILIIVSIVLSSDSEHDKKVDMDNFYETYLDETSDSIIYDIVGIEKEDEYYLITYLDEENNIKDIEANKSDFKLDRDMNKDVKESLDSLGYIELKPSIDIELIKEKIKLDNENINLDIYNSFLEYLEKNYSSNQLKSITVFNLDVL